jgi:NAD(P)-dependent dehydrogenase (short-subunit alcohol dehydrogenase family)
MKLKNRVAIITGSGRGIGEAIALEFAKEGANLTLVSRTFQEVENVAKAAKKYDTNAFPIEGDVSEEKTVEGVVRKTIEEYSKIDILVNCAGILGPIGRFDKNNWREWIYTLNVNFFGSLMLIRKVIPHMIEKKYGKIINLSGGGSTSPLPNFTAYGTSKVAIVRMTETLAQEYKEFNIDINAIAPGAVNTKMLDQILKAGETAGKDYRKKILAQKESGGTPRKLVAKLAVYLASSDSDGLTGKLISAPWDDWENFKVDQNIEISKSPLYTLRRIDNMQFFEKKD